MKKAVICVMTAYGFGFADRDEDTLVAPKDTL
jgi:hypothetical protein